MSECEHKWEGNFCDLLPISLTEVEAVCTKCQKRFTIKIPNIPEKS